MINSGYMYQQPLNKHKHTHTWNCHAEVQTHTESFTTYMTCWRGGSGCSRRRGTDRPTPRWPSLTCSSCFLPTCLPVSPPPRSHNIICHLRVTHTSGRQRVSPANVSQISQPADRHAAPAQTAALRKNVAKEMDVLCLVENWCLTWQLMGRALSRWNRGAANGANWDYSHSQI